MPPPIVRLADLAPDQEADFFALLSEKQELTTRDGKPYFRVAFRDAEREVSFPVWSNSPWADACRDQWAAGEFYKLRAKLQESNFGPQLEIRRIRLVNDADRTDGFEPLMCVPRSRFEPQELFDEMLSIVEQRIADEQLRDLVASILRDNQELLLVLPAAQHNHHAFVAGYLEHVLNVVRTCVFLADRYAELYHDMQPPLNKDLVIAGAVLHDIGKLRELAAGPAGAHYTAGGGLLGHMIQGRDIVREAAAGRSIDPEILLRLEHVIIAHQRLPEWGAPKPPMTPEALIVHYADDLDAKLHMMIVALRNEPGDGPLTSRKNTLHQVLYRGGL